MPKVSVIIPTFNRGAFICEAIDCVLKQTYKDVEIIVVDDGSTDDTQAKLTAYRDKIKYIYQSNHGVASARNTGIKASIGEYLAFLDSDDLWFEDKLLIQTQILDADPYIGLTYSVMIVCDEHGKCRGIKPTGNPGNNFKELIDQGGHYPTSTVMLRRKCIARVGYFDENFVILEDFDLWLRISHQYKIFPFTEKPLAVYRWHKDNSFLNELEVYKSQVKLHQKILSDFPEAPWKVVSRKLAKNQYLLSKIYLTQNNADLAMKNLFQALRIDPGLGSYFWQKEESVFAKLVKILKPYYVLGICVAQRIMTHKI